jgi:CheY-like chemotaxis protein
MNILIVDDDEDDRDLLTWAIHDIQSSINCIMARSGQEAMKGLRANKYPRPNLIFLDLNMPGLNGFQCLSEIKQDIFLQDIPVVIYTTSKRKEDEARARSLGADYFITKPPTVVELQRSIEKVLAKELIHL